MLRDYPDSEEGDIFQFKTYNKAYCNSWVGTAVLGSAVIGGLTTAYTSSKAAKTQSDAALAGANAQKEAAATGAAGIKYAADKAAEIQKYAADQGISYIQAATKMANEGLLSQIDYAKATGAKTQANFDPNIQAGGAANAELQKQLPFLTSPIVMDQATLEQTPGYQFTKTQGLKAVQNSAAARGLGVSGAALKGAATFATGLADNTYQNQFANENTNRTNVFNRLKGLVDTGVTAATAEGSQANDLSKSIISGQAQLGANTIAGGAATVQGLNTGANATAQGLLTGANAEAQGLTTGANATQAGLVGSANAQAAGYNALGQAVGNTANNIGGYAAYKGLYGGGGNGFFGSGNAPLNINPNVNAGNPGGTAGIFKLSGNTAFA